MKSVRLSVLDALKDAIPSIVEEAGLKIPSLKEIIPKEEFAVESPGKAEPVRISMTFCPDPITTTWDWSDLDHKNQNDDVDCPKGFITHRLLLVAVIQTTPLFQCPLRCSQ